MFKQVIRATSLGIGLISMLFFSFGGIEPSYASSPRRRRKKSFSFQEVDELLARYIPPQNLLAARFMMACQGSEADIKTNRAMLKELAYSNVNIDRLTDEEVSTICYFLGQLVV